MRKTAGDEKGIAEGRKTAGHEKRIAEGWKGHIMRGRERGWGEGRRERDEDGVEEAAAEHAVDEARDEGHVAVL